MAKNYFEIKIQSGNTLSGLAKQYNTTVEDLVRLNTIKDPDKISEGAMLKIPIYYSSGYQTQLDQRLEALYQGEYGTTGAREKLGNELKALYPTIDVWTDIYSFVPDDWDKIAFPKETVKTPEDLPKIKLPAWQQVGSFISDRVIDPVKDRVKSVAWDIFKSSIDIPTPEKVFSQAKQTIGLTILQPLAKEGQEMQTSFSALLDRLKKVPSYVDKALDKRFQEHRVLKEIGNLADVFHTRWTEPTPTWEEVKQTWGDVPESLPWVGDFLKAQKESAIGISEDYESGYDAATKAIDIPTSLELPNSAIAKGAYDGYRDDLLNQKDFFEEIGVFLDQDDYGFLTLDNELTEKAIAEHRDRVIENLQKAFPDSDPNLDYGLYTFGEIQNSKLILVGSLIEGMNDLRQELLKPENASQKEMQTVLKTLENILGVSSYLETIDPTLETLDEELEKFNHSAVDLEAYYEEQVPKWWADLERLIGKDFSDLLRKPGGFTGIEELEYNKKLLSLSEKEIVEVFNLTSMIGNAQVFEALEDSISSTLDDPAFLQALQNLYNQDPQKNTKELNSIAAIFKGQTWLKDNVEEIRGEPGFQSFLSQLTLAESEEDFSSLRNGIEENHAITQGQFNAAIEAIDYFEKFHKGSKILEEAIHNLGKATDLWKRASNVELLKQGKKDVEKLDSYLEKSTLSLVTFPLSKATWEDFWTALKFGWDIVGTKELPGFVKYPSSWESKKVSLPTGGSFEMLLPAEWKGNWKVNELLSKIWWDFDKVEKVWLKDRLLPAIFGTIDTVREALNYVGTGDLLAPLWEDEPKLETMKRFQAFRATLGLSEDAKVSGLNVSAGDVLRYYPNYWKKAMDAYRNPEAYTEFTLKEDVKLSMTEDGKVRLNGIVFNNLKSHKDFWLFNKELWGQRKIKAGTKIIIPRYQPFSGLFDYFLTPDQRTQAYLDNPLFATVIDQVLPYFIPLDPLDIAFAGSHIAAAKWGKTFDLTLQKIPMIGDFMKRGEAYDKLLRLQNFSENLLGIIGFRGADWGIQKSKLAKKLTMRVDKFRAVVGQTTVLKGLSSESQAMATFAAKFIRESTDMSYLSLKADEIVESVMKEAGLGAEFRRSISAAMFDPFIAPDGNVRKVMGKMGLTTFALMEWADARPYLKDEVKSLHESLMALYHERSKLAFKVGFERMTDDAKDFFMSVWDDWKKPWNARKIKTPADLERFADDFIKMYVNKSYALNQVKDAKKLLNTYLAELEIGRQIGEKAKAIIRVPMGYTLSKVADEDLIKLKGKDAIILVNDDGTRQVLYDPAKFKLREYGVWNFMTEDYFDLKASKLNQIPYAKVENRLQKSRWVATDVDQYIAKVELVIAGKKTPKGTLMNIDDWFKAIGHDEFFNRTKFGDILLSNVRGAAKKRKITEYISKTTPALTLFDAVKSDFFQVFLKKQVDGMEGIKDFLAKISKGATETKTKIISRTSEWYEKYEDTLHFKGITPYTEEVVEVTKTVKYSNEAIQLFVRRAASLDLLRETRAGRQQLVRYKNFLEALKPTYHTDLTRLDALLLKTFPLNNILPFLTRNLLLRDEYTETIWKQILNALKKYQKHASDEFSKAVQGYWKGVRTKAGEPIIRWSKLWDEDLLKAEIKKYQEVYKLGLKEDDLATIIPKLWGRVERIRKPKEALVETFEEGLKLVKKRSADNLVKLDNATSRTVMVRFREIGKQAGEILRKKQNLLRRYWDEMLDYKKSTFYVLKNVVNPGLILDEDLINILNKLPKPPPGGRYNVRTWFEITDDISASLRKTDSGRKLLEKIDKMNIKKYKDFIQENLKVSVEQQDKITGKFFRGKINLFQLFGIEDWQPGDKIPWRIISDTSFKVRPEEFYTGFIENLRILKTYVEEEGIEIFLDKGKISKIDLIKPFKEKVAQKLLKDFLFIEDADVTVNAKVILDKFSDILHAQTYKSPLAFRKYLDKLEQVRVWDNALAILETDRKLISHKVTTLTMRLDVVKGTDEATEVSKLLQARRIELSDLNSKIDSLSKKLDVYQSGIANLLTKYGNPLFPGYELHPRLIDIMSGSINITHSDTLWSFKDEIEILLRSKKKSLASLEAKIKEMLEGVILRKEFLPIWKDRFLVMDEIKELELLKDIMPDLNRIQKAGILLTWEEIFNYSKGMVSPSLQKKLSKIESVLSTPLKKGFAPIFISKENHKLLSLSEIQGELKKLKMKDEPLELYIKKWLGPNFGAKDYKLPIIRVAESPITSQKFLEMLEDYNKKGVKVIVDLSGDLTEKVYRPVKNRGFRVVTIDELMENMIPDLSKRGDIPMKGEIDGILKLRKVFLEGTNILIWDSDIMRAKRLRELLEETLSPNARRVMLAAQDILIDYSKKLTQKGAIGPTFRFPRRGELYLKVFGDPKGVAVSTAEALIPEKAVERALRPFVIDDAFNLVRNKAIRSGLTPKALYELGDISKRVPTLVIVSDRYRDVINSTLRKIEDIWKKQGGDIYLPKKRNTGEQIVMEYLESKKIPFKILDADINPDVFINPAKQYSLSAHYPAFIFPVGKNYESKRQKLYDAAKTGWRLFKPQEVLEKELLDVMTNDISEWIRDSKKYVPRFIRDEVYSLRKDPKRLLAKWKGAINRTNAKKYWHETMKEALDLDTTKLTERLLRESGNKVLSAAQRDFIKSSRKRWQNAIDMMDHVFEFDKKPSFWENLQGEINRLLELSTDNEHRIQKVFGVPLPSYTNLKYPTQFLKLMAKTLVIGKDITQVARSGLGMFRSLWIMSVLYWRPAWYLKNAFDDGLRGAMAARSVEYWLKTQMMFYGTAASFVRKFTGDLIKIPTFIFKPSSKMMREIEDMLGADAALKYKNWWEEAMSQAGQMPYDIWDPKVALKVRNDGFWKHLDTDFWKTDIENLWKLDELLEDGPILTPKGEWFDEKIYDWMAGQGFMQSMSDPIMLRKKISLMSETSWWKRLKKRSAVIQGDLEVFANFTESMRRKLLIDDLIFNKAMSIAEAKNKVWTYLFNYDDLTLVGKTFRYFFPFYAFNSKTIGLYLKIFAQHPKRLVAARIFLDAWSQATEDLPDWAKNRIPVGNDFYWYPWASIVQFLAFFKDPEQMLKDFAENPLMVPLGFGWDPFYGHLVKQAQEHKAFDLKEDIKVGLGWTEEEVEKWVKDQQIKTNTSGDWMSLLMEYVPFSKAIKALTEVDMYMLMDGVSIWRSKKLRETAKIFGINILKWDDMDKFRSIYFNSPPHIRRDIAQQLEADNPLAWQALKNYWAKTAYLKSARAAKIDPVKATADLQLEGWKFTYYGMYDEDPNAARLWLERNPEAKEVLEEEWAKDTSPWRMIQRYKFNVGQLSSEIRIVADKIYKEEVIARSNILGIDISFAVPGDRQAFIDLFFDERGNLRIASREALEVIFGKAYADTIINNTRKSWQELIKDQADIRYHQWLGELNTAETAEDKAFAKRMSLWQKILPDNINELSEKDAQKYWAAYWSYFENQFTEDQKQHYYLSLRERHSEWFVEYRDKMREYVAIWDKLIDKFDEKDFQFFVEFEKQPVWFQNLYFLTYPNKKIWYPIASEWTSLLTEIEVKEKSGIFQADLRKKASEYFWSHEDTVKNYWDKDNPGFYEYMKTWQKIIVITETDPRKYFETFYSQPFKFRERFFKRNPDKRIYYPFVQKWVQLLEEDTQIFKTTGIKSTKAKDYFWADNNSAKRKAYGASKFIAPGHSILEYLKLWDNLFYRLEEKIEDYFPLFKKQPEWFKKHFFNSNPNKALYYPHVSKWVALIAEDKISGTTKARSYYLKFISGVKEIRDAWNAENPRIIEYLDIWTEIMIKTEINPEAYFIEFYSQLSWFKERFFKNNPDKKEYYPKVRAWIQAIQLDKKNWETKGIRTHVARDQFNSWKNTLAGKLYGQANPITKTKNIIDYLEAWQVLMEYTEENPKDYFAIFNKQEDWFKDRFFKNNPLKKKYYWFASALAKKSSEEFGKYFWSTGTRYSAARQAWDKDKPGFLDYMKFWRHLSSLADTGQWNLYFSYYFSNKNSEWRLRHEKNNPGSTDKFTILWDYQKLPSITWEDRRAKRQYVKSHPKLLEWWGENLSLSESQLRIKTEKYYSLLDNIPATGEGRDYYLEVRKWEVEAQEYLEDNPDVLLHLQRNSKKYTGEKPDIYVKLDEYNAIFSPSEKKDYVEEHPELKEYFNNLKPPGIRKIIALQDKYFALPEDQRNGFLLLHPELIDYWEIRKLPASYFLNPAKFKPYQEAVDQFTKVNNLFLSQDWIQAEKLRNKLPQLFLVSEVTPEHEWLRTKTYSEAMATWAKLWKINDFWAVYYFRQLPRWLREIYYFKHPEKRYLSTNTLSRFLEEPLRLWHNAEPRLFWAYAMHYKYGKNMPPDIKKEVRKIMIEFNQWEDRSDWTRGDWQRYWADRSLYLNDANAQDFANIPLLATELEKVKRNYPLKIHPPMTMSAPKMTTIHPIF